MLSLLKSPKCLNFDIIPLLATCLLLTVTIRFAYSEQAPNAAMEQDFEDLGLHYGKYLKEVVAALDKDKNFTDTIKNMSSEDIKSGKVAEQLKLVHENVRQKLNELKYLEIKRLRDLATRKNEMDQYGETYHGTDRRKWRTLGATLSQLPEHLGSDSNHFDVNDFHKLMVAATNDLEKIDKERREDFKTYEMEKEWQFEQRLRMMNETERQEAIKQRQKLKEQHDDHPKISEPGHEQSFKTAWKEQDHLPENEFDPKTFFTLHDTNSDSFWDPEEVKKVLETELRKMYDPNRPEDDPNEMEEERERMREHVYEEMDTDRDGLISRKEFLDYSRTAQFKQDNGWEDNSKRQAYTKDDYEDFAKNRERYLRNSHGYYNPEHYANQPQNMHLPYWGYGMPPNVDPAQYYGYHIDPNHPQAQQMMAQQQHLAYQQQAAMQQAAGAGPYQQHPAQAAMPQQTYQQPQIAQPTGSQQQYYQQPQIAQHQQQPQPNYQQPIPQQQASLPQQPSYQQPPQGQQPPIQQQPPVIQQQQPPVIQQQQPPVVQQQQQQIHQQQPQAAIPQQNMPQQNIPQQAQQAIPQQPLPQQQQVPQQQVPHR